MQYNICNKFVIELTYFYIKIIRIADFRCNFEMSNKTRQLITVSLSIKFKRLSQRSTH